MKTRLGEPESGGGVGHVRLEPGMGFHDCQEARQLVARERQIGVGGRQVAHQPDGVVRQRRQLPHPVPPHARVDLDVDRQT